MIIEKKNDTATFFRLVAQGEVFRYQGEYYIKTEILEEGIANCVKLRTGNYYLRFNNDLVYKVECRLVID